MRRSGIAAALTLALLAACTATYLPTESRMTAGPSSTPSPMGVAKPASIDPPNTPARKVGVLAATISGHCLQQECALGNLLADAVLWQLAEKGAAAVILPSRAVRGFLREGDVTSRDLETAIAREIVSLRDMRGAEIRSHLEDALKPSGAGATAFPQVAGLRYVWSPSHPPGRRLMSVQIADGKGGFEPLVNSRPYRIAVDGATNAPVLATVETDRALAAYLERRSPLPAPSNGRIVER